mmetsp:Transcript_46083/g.81863  ORF Transcript_46083/g.81863 Transcript_46083/m.81863 type:complete len:358 (-) Transcript_46083:146-1219(-)
MTNALSARGLPCLLSQRTGDNKALQARRARHISCSIRRLPTILETDCEDSISAPAPSLPCPARLPHSITDPLVPAAPDVDVIVAGLKKGSQFERSQLLAWLFQSMWGATLAMACSENGSRILQAILEVTSSKEHSALLAQVKGSVMDLATSEHGHEVLMRLIELLPSPSTGFVIQEFAGSCKTIARHRYGCHVLNHLIMHFSAAQMADLTNEVLQETADLSRQEHGNLVLQHLLEYGTVASQQRIVRDLLPTARSSAMHKIASRVLQQVLEHCERNEQLALARAMLQPAKASLTDVACSRCGSAVLRRMADAGLCADQLRAHLAMNVARLQKSKYGSRVLTSFRVSTLPCTASTLAP